MGKDTGRAVKICQLMKTLKTGESFLLEDTSQKATHYATTWGIPVATQTCLLIEGYKTDKPIISKITKVIIK